MTTLMESYVNRGERRTFMEAVIEGDWREVIPRFEASSDHHKIKIKGKGTALHVAVNNGDVDVVRSLVEAVVRREGEETAADETTSALATRNEQGASPLHLAARRGFNEICNCIIGAGGERKSLMYARNHKGETPLFSAVKTRRLKTFTLLHQLIPSDINLAIRNKNDSILHIAIRREFLDMAVLILHCYPTLFNLRDADEATPLEVLAARPSAFKSGTYLSWWKQVLYHCIYVKPLDAKAAMRRYSMSKGVGNNQKDKSQVSIQLDPIVETSREISECARYADINVTCVWFLDIIRKLVFIFCLPCLSLLGITGADLVAIKKLKQKHNWAGQLLNNFMENPYQSYMGNDGDDPLRIVMRKMMKKNGIVENKIESVVHDTNSKKENVLLVAVKNRQPYVVMELKKSLELKSRTEQFKSLAFETDKEDNTVLHMAAGSVSNSEKTWQIAGTAMQMMWDIKALAPEHLAFRINKDGKTPGEVFQEQHRVLVSESSKWLKDTAESCSVVAALITGISFATASTVPGGSKQDSSHSFLGWTLLLSDRIGAMLVAFCSGNFFLLKDKYNFYAIVQFPLYADLVKTILKKVPPPSGRGSGVNF